MSNFYDEPVQNRGSKSALIIYFVSIFVLSALFVLLPFTLKLNSSAGKVKGISTFVGRPFLISDNGAEAQILSGGTSVKEVLNDAQIEYYPEDIIKAFPDPSIGLGGKITIERATPIRICDGGQWQTVRTWKKTVGELLEEKSIVLDKQDRLLPSSDTELIWNMPIKITRIGTRTVTEKQTIDFDVQYKDDNSMLVGTTKVEQGGVDGEKELIYEYKYQDGNLIEKRLVSEKVIKEAKDKIIIRGTKRLYLGSGEASWYYDSAGSCAHRTLPVGTRILVRASNGHVAICTVRGWGPKASTGRIIDLSSDVFSQLAPLSVGKISVTLEKA